jgi:hypothetical protein
MALGATSVPSHMRPTLHEVGRALDLDQQIRVLRGGIVVAGAATSDTEKKDQCYEPQGTPRPATGPRQGSAGRQGPASRSRSPGAVSRLRRGSIQSAYHAHLSELKSCYPTTQVWKDERGLWLAIESAVLPGLDFAATFLVGLPFAPDILPRAWGFWTSKESFRWIGPRHTNLPDGSMCAFAPDARVWVPGESLTALTDLYSVWALRHLFLAEFDRWPGRQYGPCAFYRLVEFREQELCNCESGRTYFECCRPIDLAKDFLSSKREFDAWSGGCELAHRKAPAQLLEFLTGLETSLPSLAALHPDL